MTIMLSRIHLEIKDKLLLSLSVKCTEEQKSSPLIFFISSLEFFAFHHRPCACFGISLAQLVFRWLVVTTVELIVPLKKQRRSKGEHIWQMNAE